MVRVDAARRRRLTLWQFSLRRFEEKRLRARGTIPPVMLQRRGDLGGYPQAVADPVLLNAKPKLYYAVSSVSFLRPRRHEAPKFRGWIGCYGLFKGWRKMLRCKLNIPFAQAIASLAYIPSCFGGGTGVSSLQNFECNVWSFHLDPEWISSRLRDLYFQHCQLEFSCAHLQFGCCGRNA